jgi:hypothetical protein
MEMLIQFLISFLFYDKNEPVGLRMLPVGATRCVIIDVNVSLILIGIGMLRMMLGLLIELMGGL